MADSELVYTTDRAAPDGPARPGEAAVDPSRTVLTLRREKQGRKGKEVTTIAGLPDNEAYGRALAKALKTACGAGGTWKAGHIEIQGDHRDTVENVLAKRGFRVKRAGG